MPEIRFNTYEKKYWKKGNATFRIACAPDGRCFILIPSAGGNGKGTHNQDRIDAILWIQDRANDLGFNLFDIHSCNCSTMVVKCGENCEIKGNDLLKGIAKLEYGDAPLAFTFDGLTNKVAQYLCGADNLEDTFRENSLKRLAEEQEEARKVYSTTTTARDQKAADAARKRDNYKCQFPGCDNTFKSLNGVPYVEVHHLTLVKDEGSDDLDNLVCLCGHHHAMIHYADAQTCARMTRKLRELVRGKQ